MSQVRQFIDQIAAGQSADAKESLENILSGKAFESLDLYKKEISSSIFGGIEEEKECDTEDDEDDEDEKEEDDEDLKKESIEDYSLEEIEEFMMSEDFEQLDELSKSTLQSYLDKSEQNYPESIPGKIKRLIGRNNARRRIETGKVPKKTKPVSYNDKLRDQMQKDAIKKGNKEVKQRQKARRDAAEYELNFGNDGPRRKIKLKDFESGAYRNKHYK